MKYYQTQEFKALRKQWRQHLASSGFDDQENDKDELKQPNERTRASEDREQVSAFFSRIGYFLGGNTIIPLLHRDVLDLYSQGMWIEHIACRLQVNERTIRRIITKYKEDLVYS